MKLEQMNATYWQESDSCQDDINGQTLFLSTDDAGGRKFLILKTKRWSLDRDDIPAFTKFLEDFMRKTDDE